MDTGHMLSLLVENRLISTPGARKVSDFVGDFNYLGYVSARLHDGNPMFAERQQFGWT